MQALFDSIVCCGGRAAGVEAPGHNELEKAAAADLSPTRSIGTDRTVVGPETACPFDSQDDPCQNAAPPLSPTSAQRGAATFGQAQASRPHLCNFALVLIGEVEVVNGDRGSFAASDGEELLQLLHQGGLAAALRCLHANHQGVLATLLLVALQLILAPEEDWQVVLIHSQPAADKPQLARVCGWCEGKLK